MKVSRDETKNIIKIEDLRNFYPKHVFECGQAFRWDKKENGYVGLASGRVINVSWNEDTLYLENSTMEDFNDLWRDYFDLSTDYQKIIKDLSKDEIMKDAISHGWGIRILNQDPFETTISFIISARNSIDRIKKTVGRLSEKFGERIVWKGSDYYTFPTPKALANAGEDELGDCGCAYRSPYVKRTAKMVFDGEINFEEIINLDYESAKKELQRCPGIGPKVADCILLFSMGKRKAFPVDVWVDRVMKALYSKELQDYEDIRAFAKDRFGELGGYAQQYLFYYAREKRIGK